MNTTIQIDKSIVKSLREVKEYPRQTYNELLDKMIQLFRNYKKNNQQINYLYQIQRQKMKELWDNKEDDVWANV